MFRYFGVFVSATMLLGFGIVSKLTEAAPAPKLTEAEKELINLQGTWVGVSLDFHGEVSNSTDAVLIFERDTFTFKRQGKFVKGTVTIDPSKEPKTIDLKVTAIANADPSYKDKVFLGLYELKDDSLKWCSFEPHDQSPRSPRGRPEEIGTKVLGDFVFTFKRSKS